MIDRPHIRHVNGMHHANDNMSDWPGMLAAIGERGAVTMLHMQAQAGDYQRIRAAHPLAFIHIRQYQPNWTELDPHSWAVTGANMMRQIGAINDPLAGISPANEQNLHYEAGDPDPAHQPQFKTVDFYRRIADWNRRWHIAFDAAAPQRQCLTVWPALAQGHEPPGMVPDGEYMIPAIRGAVGLYDVMATHPYGHLEWGDGGLPTLPGARGALWHMLRDFRPKGYKNAADPGGVLAQFPNKPVLMSETGTFAHADHARTHQSSAAILDLYREAALSGRVLGVTPFIWATDHAHPTNDLSRNPDLRMALANAPRFETRCPVPEAGKPWRAILPAVPDPGVPPTPIPTPISPTLPPGDGDWPPRISAAVEPAATVAPGEGWAAFAARCRGYDPGLVPYRVRLQWAREIREANGAGDDAPLRAGHAYKVPWFTVAP